MIVTDGSVQYVGSRSGYVKVPYAFGNNTVLDHLNTNYYHIHGTPWIYPNHADDVTLTAGAGAWDLTGTITEVVPADTLTTSAFDIHWINISSISGNGTIQIDVYKGGEGVEVLISSVRATRTTVTSPEGAHRIQIPQQAPGTRISCRASDGTAGALTCAVGFEGHFYAG